VPEDPAELEAFVAERVTPKIEKVEANVPEVIATDVGVMTTAVDSVVSSGDFSAFETPEFTEAQGTVYPALSEMCGYAKLEVTAVDYSYEGVPETMEAGTTVLVLDNQSQSGEYHEMGIVKLKDGADISLDELLALPEEETEQYIDPSSFGIGAYAAPGQSGGTTFELTPGRWIYACFIPVGTTDPAQEGSGPPHFMEGMAGEFTVE
jgi:hypothetical protein